MLHIPSDSPPLEDYHPYSMAKVMTCYVWSNILGHEVISFTFDGLICQKCWNIGLNVVEMCMSKLTSEGEKSNQRYTTLKKYSILRCPKSVLGIIKWHTK